MINDDLTKMGTKCAVNEDEISVFTMFAEHHDGRWDLNGFCVWSTCRSLSTSVSSSEKAPTTTMATVLVDGLG